VGGKNWAERHRSPRVQLKKPPRYKTLNPSYWDAYRVLVKSFYQETFHKDTRNLVTPTRNQNLVATRTSFEHRQVKNIDSKMLGDYLGYKHNML
jgi:hypothetical protein